MSQATINENLIRDVVKEVLGQLRGGSPTRPAGAGGLNLVVDR